MKPSTLLVACALTLASSNLLAYQIVESHFHVEVAPNKYVDQLVLRCEDGRQVTVPWQSKLAESCGEDLMGNVTAPPPKAAAAPIDEQQKQAMLDQLRSQYGNISEKQVEFISGPAGVSTRFKPPIVEILKKYESCRKALKDKGYCAGERDKALARLADPKPPPTAAPAPESTESASREPAIPAVAAASVPEAPSGSPASGSASQQAKTQTTASTTEAPSRSPASTATPKQAKTQSEFPVQDAPSRVPGSTATPQQAKSQSAVRAAEVPSRTPATAAAPQQAVSQTATPTPAPTEATPQPAASTPAAEAQAAQPSDADLRAAAEQKINQDYMACMRAKPKFDCDQARTKSTAALDKPKVAKPRKSAAGPQAQR
jgi:hypothetical protein